VSSAAGAKPNRTLPKSTPRHPVSLGAALFLESPSRQYGYVKLTSLTIDLAPTGVFLDTDFFTGPGAALSLDISLITGAGATGFTGLTTPGRRDGATTFTLAFSDFGHGESFGFETDVDECSNDFSSAAATLACSLVNGAEFAGAKVSFVFTGPGGINTQLATFLSPPSPARYRSRPPGSCSARPWPPPPPYATGGVDAQHSAVNRWACSRTS